jgi:hypothetical protein
VTFHVFASRLTSVSVTTCIVTGPACVAVYTAEASAKLSPTTGMGWGVPRVPMNSSWRPSWPSLKMMTAS